MLLGQSSVSESAADIVFDVDQFRTGLPSEQALLNLALAPTSDSSKRDLGEPDNPVFASTLQRNAVALAQAAHAISIRNGLSGLDSFGSKSIANLTRLVGQETFDLDANVRALATAGVESVIDLLIDGPLKSVPFVGTVASTVWAIAQAMFAAAGNESRLPPMFRMDPFVDEVDTREAIRMLKNGDDWTSLFLPRTEGLWGLTPHSDGSYTSVRQIADRYRGQRRLGCAPGDLFYVDAGVQSRVGKADVTIPSNSSEPKGRSVLQTGNNPQALHSLVYPISEWYPSLSSLGRSVWSMVGTRESTALFQVDAHQVAEEWAQFATATNHLRRLIDDGLEKRVSNLGKDFKRGYIARYLGNVGAAMHTLRERDDDDKLRSLNREQLLAAALDPSKRAGGDTVGRQAVLHANDLRKRQEQAARTPLNALVSKDAAALRNNTAQRDAFLAERTQLLEAGKFDNLLLSDVPDGALRQRITARRGSQPLTDAPTNFADAAMEARRQQHVAELNDSLKVIDKPRGFGGYGAQPDADDTAGGGFGTALIGLGIAGALTAGGVFAFRRLRS